MAQEIEGVKSKAAIVDHPIHPMLIPFPISFLMASLISDSIYAANKDKFWSRASLWLTGGGLAGGMAAAGAGLTDFIALRRAHSIREGWIHALGNTTAMGLAASSLALRINNRDKTVLPLGLSLSASIAALLVMTAWYGGEMVYRHKIGVMPRSRMVSMAEEEARKRAA